MASGRIIGGQTRKLFGQVQKMRPDDVEGGIGTAGVLTGGIGTAGVLTGGIGTAGVLTGGARDFVARLDGGAKRMMMELKDKPDSQLKQLYHDLGKQMFHAIRRVLMEDFDVGVSVSAKAKPKAKPKAKAPPKRKIKSSAESIAENIPEPASLPKPKRVPRISKSAPENVREMADVVDEQMIKPVPKARRPRRVVGRLDPQGNILKSGNPDGAIVVKDEVDAPGVSVPTRAQITQSYTSGSGGRRPKRAISDKMKKRGEAVKRLMREKGMSLGEASRYLKEHPEA